MTSAPAGGSPPRSMVERSSTARGSGLPSRTSVPHHCATPTQEEYSSVSEPQRLALYRAAQAALGEEEGDTLMSLTPPANTDIATRQDVEHAQALMKADVEHAQALMSAQLGEMTGVLRAEIAEANGVLRAEIAEANGVLRAEIAEVKGALGADIERMGNRTLRWTVGSMLAGNTAVVALLTLLLR
jgi:hypothetical protein